MAMGLSLCLTCLLTAILMSLLTEAGSMPTEIDCSRYKSQYTNSHIGAFRALAEADLVIESKSMTINVDSNSREEINVQLNCSLKGDPRQDQLLVRLLHSGTRCVDAEALGTVTTNNPNSRFVFALSRRRSRPAGWDLLDGGLFSAEDFYKLFNGNGCNATDLTSIYSGTCRTASESTASQCFTFKLIVTSLKMKEKQPYISSASESDSAQAEQADKEPLQPPPSQKPSGEPPTNSTKVQQQQQQQEQHQQDSGMLASDQPSASAAKKFGEEQQQLLGADADGHNGKGSAGRVPAGMAAIFGLTFVCTAAILVS
ncbi:hypothetical protein BOX15_Mlig013394g2 [Macrostomum lignano]|uniref:Uncharacterized protein n=1 Tax=Macrostomum lignano TaxID=282301 RepID=A0A267DSH1_9PLAT|nr:hypothetical protein BOX15_Mlig013394g2 [Macrostomum lignano]